MNKDFIMILPLITNISVTFFYFIVIHIVFAPFCFSNTFSANNEENIIWKEDFSSGNISDWEIIDDKDDQSSNWFLEEGYLIQDSDIGSKSELLGTNIIYKNGEWEECIIHSNIICTDDDYIGIIFQYKDIDNYYRFVISSEKKEIRLDQKSNGVFRNKAMLTEEWEFVKFSVTIFQRSGIIKVLLNNREYLSVNESHFVKGKVGFVSISNLGSFFDDITIYSDYRVIPVEERLIFSRGPYLQSVLGDSAVIMWNTSQPANSIVEYGESKEVLSSLISNDHKTLHEMKLKNLKPETKYFYRITSGGQRSEFFTFRTAVSENNSFSFIAYGDNQMNFLRHTEIARQISNHDFDFIVSCGDVVQYGPRDEWDTEFFGPLKDILTGKTIFTAIGNHEQNSENYFSNFSYPNSQHENYYSFKYGNSYFIFIDNPRTAYPHKEHYTDISAGSKQYEWLERELSSDAAQKSEWLFVISHIPSYIAGSQEHFPLNKKILVPLFEKYKIDMNISGHVHGYERGVVNGITYLITAGGGGAQNKNSMSQIKQADSFRLVYNFSHIEVNGKEVIIRVYDIKNKLIDEFKLIH